MVLINGTGYGAFMKILDAMEEKTRNWVEEELERELVPYLITNIEFEDPIKFPIYFYTKMTVSFLDINISLVVSFRSTEEGSWVGFVKKLDNNVHDIHEWSMLCSDAEALKIIGTASELVKQ